MGKVYKKLRKIKKVSESAEIRFKSPSQLQVLFLKEVYLSRSSQSTTELKYYPRGVLLSDFIAIMISEKNTNEIWTTEKRRIDVEPYYISNLGEFFKLSSNHFLYRFVIKEFFVFPFINYSRNE